jgi:2-polyprenyl-6-methoxyphenol hydroxylase-like FAD-dependent oxidoreductase
MRILITGAGLAGLSAGITFGGSGHDVTIVERAARLRTGGSPIDLRGDAIGAAGRMGVLDAVRDAGLTMTETVHFVGSDGAVLATVPQAMVGDSADDIEIAREDLTRILRDALPDGVRLIFDEHVTALADDGTGVDATFASGSTDRFDLVIGADGIHSATRRLVFGPESEYLRPLGYYVAFGLMPGREESTSRENSFYNYPGHLIGFARYHDKVIAVATFRSEPLDHDYRDPDSARRILAEAFAGHDEWRVPELVDALVRDPDLYFDTVAQIHMDSWHRGRVVLLGDAASGPSGLSGRGTSLALTGASILAEALGTHPDDVGAALAEYEERQRPYVTHAQATAAPGGELLVPPTIEAIEERNRQLNSYASAPVSP